LSFVQDLGFAKNVYMNIVKIHTQIPPPPHLLRLTYRGFS
jgi:hypothetical protein